MAQWTPKDITVLKMHYGKKFLSIIAKMVKRSEAAVGMFLAKHRADFPALHPTRGRHASTKTNKVARKATNRSRKAA